MRLEPTGWCKPGRRYYHCAQRRAGSAFNTADDLTRIRRNSNWCGPGQRGNSPLVNLVIEHDRGPFNGRAEVSGIVTDVTGASIPGAKIELRKLPARSCRKRGQMNREFRVFAVPPGRYEIRITARGFEVSSLQSTLEPRDWAVLTVQLRIASESAAVTVVTGADAEVPVRHWPRLFQH